jgi:hypothetical protein
MKMLVALCAAVAAACLAVYLVVSHQKTAQFERERQVLQTGWDSEKAELEAALRAAKRPSSVPTVSAPAAEPALGKLPAHEILERLKKTKVLPGEQRNASIRRIVHQLESLVDLGPEALPEIKEFLAKFEDVDYSTETRPEDKEFVRDPESKDKPASAPVPGSPTLPRLDSVLAPSLRLGLVQVLREMGTEQAEQVLVDMLTTSGRGVEVAYVARVLQEMAPNKYRDVAVAAAKDLLANPPAIDRPNRLDDNAKNYLYGILSMYSDPSFASSAQNLLVTADGRVDRTTLNYLTSTLKEEAVPALYQAFKDNRLTNLWERASLATQILSFTGSSQQANDIFKEVLSNDSYPTWLRATAIQTVGGGRGQFFGGAAPTDAGQIKSRLDLLTSLPEPTDERLVRARNDAIQQLNDRLTDTGDAESGRSFRTRLNRGQPAADTPPPLPIPR